MVDIYSGLSGRVYALHGGFGALGAIHLLRMTTSEPRLHPGGYSGANRGATVARINFIELPAHNIDQAKAFYSQAFGWSLADFGPTYSCTMTGDVDLGLQGDGAEATAGPLAVIAVENLEEALAAVQKAGGAITKPTFSFPGGRRFHFRDPSGNELAVLKAD